MDRDSLVIQNTSLANWYSLISEAGHTAGVQLDEDLESYLVFLLMRFSTSSQLSKSVVALEYLQSMQEQSSQQSEHLRGIGDKCLLFAGLFPGVAERRRLRISYFVHIGQGAYYAVSSIEKKRYSDLFELLSRKFISLMEVLHSVRALNKAQDSITPLQAVELWQDTASKQAIDRLEMLQKKIILFGSKDSKTLH